MGLRLAEGIDEAHFARRTGQTIDIATDPDVLERALAEGYLARAEGRLRALPEGLQRLDALLPALAA